MRKFTPNAVARKTRRLTKASMLKLHTRIQIFDPRGGDQVLCWQADDGPALNAGWTAF